MRPEHMSTLLEAANTNANCQMVKEKPPFKSLHGHVSSDSSTPHVRSCQEEWKLWGMGTPFGRNEGVWNWIEGRLFHPTHACMSMSMFTVHLSSLCNLLCSALLIFGCWQTASDKEYSCSFTESKVFCDFLSSTYFYVVTCKWLQIWAKTLLASMERESHVH